jgi:hypothetical protein
MEIRVQEHSAHIVIVIIDNQPRRNAMTRQKALDRALGERVRASPHFTAGVTAFRHKCQPDYS